MQQETMQQLHQQSNTIETIDTKLDAVDRNNEKSAKIVKTMSSKWQTFKSFFVSDKPQ